MSTSDKTRVHKHPYWFFNTKKTYLCKLRSNHLTYR